MMKREEDWDDLGGHPMKALPRDSYSVPVMDSIKHTLSAGFEDEPGHGYEPKPLGGPTRVFNTGATRDSDDSKLDYEGFISPLVLRRYAEYMHRCRLRNIPPGEPIRGSDNWQKGIPKEAYVKSMIRHVMEFWTQHRAIKVDPSRADELNQDTLCAIMFNVMGYLYEDLKDG